MKSTHKSSTVKIAAAAAFGIILSACSSEPSTGDIEKYLESRFEGCQNVKVVDVDKTNGYPNEQLYVVEYKYTIKNKNISELEKLEKIYAENKKIQDEINSDIQRTREATGEIFKQVLSAYFKIEEPGKPSYFEFYRISNDRGLAEEESRFNQWEPQSEAAANYKKLYLEYLDTVREIVRVDKENEAKKKPYGYAYRQVSAFYRQGCIHSQIMPDLTEIITADFASPDWYQAGDINMTAKMHMRKTEKGWMGLNQ